MHEMTKCIPKISHIYVARYDSRYENGDAISFIVSLLRMISCPLRDRTIVASMFAIMSSEFVVSTDSQADGDARPVVAGRPIKRIFSHFVKVAS